MHITSKISEVIFNEVIFLDVENTYTEHFSVLDKILTIIKKIPLTEIKNFRVYDGFLFELSETTSVKFLGDFTNIYGFHLYSPNENYRCFIIKSTNEVIYQKL